MTIDYLQKHTLTLTNTNRKINLRFVNTPLQIHTCTLVDGVIHTLSMPHFSLSFDTRREATETVCLSAPLHALPLPSICFILGSAPVAPLAVCYLCLCAAH